MIDPAALCVIVILEPYAHNLNLAKGDLDSVFARIAVQVR
jgi:hypothetical protein